MAHALLEDRLTWRSADPSLLPARREEIELRTLDGLTLVGELALPLERDPVATLVTLHPLPTAGGFMDSHILRKAAARLPALADLAVLRFNTRGTTSPRGTSEGAFDGGRRGGVRPRRGDGLRARARAAAPLAGRLVVRHRGGAQVRARSRRRGRDPALAAAAPHDAGGGRRVGGRRAPGHRASCPEFDDYLRPDAAAERFASVPDAVLIAVEGGKHLWVGENQTRRVLTEIVAAVNPDALPLPTEWDGPLGRGADQRSFCRGMTTWR